MIDIICIEDEVTFRDNLLQILEAEGYKVKGFSDGIDALNYFEENSNSVPKLIICDINLPQITGYEFVRRISDMDQKFASIPIIFLTAMGQKQDIAKGMSLKVQDYLVKPIDFDLLIYKIKAIIDKYEELDFKH